MALRALLEPEFWPAGAEAVPRPLRPAQIVLAGARRGLSTLDPPEEEYITAHRIRKLAADSIEMARCAAYFSLSGCIDALAAVSDGL